MRCDQIRKPDLVQCPRRARNAITQGDCSMATYNDVNNAWAPALPLPAITAKESAKFYLKLRRRFGAPYKGRRSITPRRVWAAPKGTTTALGTGWPRMVHDASHRVFGMLHPTFKTHSAAHADLELQMIGHVMAEGWLAPVVKAAPTVDERITADLANVDARIKRWETKARRAATALRKLRAKQKRLLARAAAA